MSPLSNKFKPLVLFAVLSLIGHIVSAAEEVDGPGVEKATRPTGGRPPRPEAKTDKVTKPEGEDNKPPSLDKPEGINALMTVKDKLEAFVRDGAADLSIDELIKVSRDFESLTKLEKALIRRWPNLRLVLDMAIAPMKMLMIPAPEMIQDKYRGFRNAYLLGERVYDNLRPSPIELRNLYSKLAQKTDRPLKLKDFVKAKEETVKLLDRMDELSEQGLIYSNLPEFTGLVNLFNDPILKPLFIYVFPKLAESSDPSELKSLYFEKLSLFGYDEEWKVIEIKSKLPGFMYVV